MYHVTVITQNILFALILLAGSFIAPAPSIPVTNGETDLLSGETSLSMPALEEFVRQVFTQQTEQVTGIYAPGTFAFPVVQQPTTNSGYVSISDGVVTQFSQATRYKSIGMLAHNNLAGRTFTDLDIGSSIVVVYGDGSTGFFEVTEVLHFQAVTPTSQQSDFIDLENTSQTLSAMGLFYRVYNAPGRLVLQTCIARNGQSSWGRLFVLAKPVNALRPIIMPTLNYQYIFTTFNSVQSFASINLHFN